MISAIRFPFTSRSNFLLPTLFASRSCVASMYRPTAVSPMIATWQRLEASSLHLQVRCSSNESDDKSATFKHTKSELDSNGGSEPIVDMARPRLVYGSPVGEVVHKLRALSLVSSLFGVVGLPTVLAIKGTMPSTGMLIMSFMFVASTVGSTAFIHAVFSPYIYRIECIPVRVCYSTKETDCSKDEPSTKTDPSPSKKEDTLLKAVKRSLFLRDVEVIFDPEQDIQPYSGFLPLCNFTAKGVPLYVHQEYVYDEKLRKALNIQVGVQSPGEKKNPDDSL